MMARAKRSRRNLQRRRMGPEPGEGLPRSQAGLYQIEWRENGRRLSRSLKHRDWSRAKRQADEVAAGLIGVESGFAELA